MTRPRASLSRLHIVALIACLTIPAVLPSIAKAQTSYDTYIYEDESFLDRMQDIESNSVSPFADLPADHWAYKAVKRLADAGLLNGYKGEKFNGDQVVTRYEMAMLVAKMLDNYLEWYRTDGRVTRQEYTTASRPGVDTAAPLRVIDPPAAIVAPGRRVSVELPSLGSMAIDRTSPKTIGEMKEPTPKDYAAELEARLTQKTEELVNQRVKEELALSLKDLDDIRKLTKEFSKELKDIRKDLEKQIKEVKRSGDMNKKEIDALKDENERFKITGKNRFFWIMEGPITGDGCLINDSTNERCNMRTADLLNTLQLDFRSKPDKRVDMTVGGSLNATTVLGGDRLNKGDRTTDPGFDSTGNTSYTYALQQSAAAWRGNIEGTNTALSLSKLYMTYENNASDAKNPRNFKLRSLYAGDYSLMFSPMTVMGKPLQGIATTLQLNDYTITMFGARERLHQREFGFIPDNTSKNWTYNTTFYGFDQYDRYKYGMSLETSVLGNPSSRMNLTRVFMFDNKDTNYPGCETGRWMNLDFSYDGYSFKSTSTDFGDTDLFCLPPVKNSVSSFFVMYPVIKNVNLFGEYAHSTYYRPYYKLLKPFDTFKTVDTNNYSLKYTSWWDVEEANYQDEAFLVIFNYAKGPLTLFPFGYLHLGPKFATDFDISAFAGGSGGSFDMGSMTSMLPMPLQGMDAMFLSAKYDFKSRSSASLLYANLKENNPLYIDLGSFASFFTNNSSKSTALLILNTPIERINSRKTKLNADVIVAGYKHFFSDKIQLDANYTQVDLNIPRSCLDGEQDPYYFNDQGDAVGAQLGNGHYQCDEAVTSDVLFGVDAKIAINSFKLSWKTSKKTNITTGYSVMDLNLNLKYNAIVEDYVYNNVVRPGKTYTISNEIKYNLTSNSRLKLAYEMNYDRYPNSSDITLSNKEAPEGYDFNSYKFPVVDNQKFMLMVESNF